MKEIVSAIVTVVIASLASLWIAEKTINNQNSALERDYKLKILEKRMSIIDDASKLIGANPGLHDMIDEVQLNAKKHKYNHELNKTITEYNEKWQTTVNLSSLYFGDNTQSVLNKLSHESGFWWDKNEDLQHEYVSAMMSEILLNISPNSTLENTSDNKIKTPDNSNANLYFIIALIVLSASWFLLFIIKKRLYSMIILMPVLWTLSGFILYCTDDATFSADWVNSAVAIGTITLAVLGITAIQQYKKQKAIDFSLENAKQALSLLFYHKCKLDTNIMRLNNEFLNEIINLQGSYSVSTPLIYPQDRLDKLLQLINEITLDINKFTDDWRLQIGIEITILNLIKERANFNTIKSNINESMVKIVSCFESIKSYDHETSSLLSIKTEHILIVNQIQELHAEILLYFKETLSIE